VKKAHLPIACPAAPFITDAIRQSYARKLAKRITLLRLILLVPRIGSSSRHQAGVKTDALDRLASETFLTGLRNEVGEEIIGYGRGQYLPLKKSNGRSPEATACTISPT
jgi:hypothetical protein